MSFSLRLIVVFILLMALIGGTTSLMKGKIDYVGHDIELNVDNVLETKAPAHALAWSTHLFQLQYGETKLTAKPVPEPNQCVNAECYEIEADLEAGRWVSSNGSFRVRLTSEYLIIAYNALTDTEDQVFPLVFIGIFFLLLYLGTERRKT